MTKNRVITLRISEQEYRELSALSMLEDASVAAIIRKAIHSYARSVVESSDYEAKVKLARERAEQAERDLRAVIGLSKESSSHLEVIK